MNHIIKKLFFTSLFSILSIVSYGQEKYVADQGAIMLDGYDPVSYYDIVPLKGSEEYSLEHDGRIFLFATEENLNKFKNDMGKYLPAYGGWCAISVALGSYIVPDYTMYKIQDGHLYFFQVRAFYNGRTAWDKAPEENKQKADKFYSVFDDQ